MQRVLQAFKVYTFRKRKEPTRFILLMHTVLSLHYIPRAIFRFCERGMETIETQQLNNLRAIKTPDPVCPHESLITPDNSARQISKEEYIYFAIEHHSE